MPDIVLSSLWDGLSPHLIASFYEVDKDGKRIEGADNVVKAPLLDGANLSISLNWQSPFESAGPESKAPTLFAMLQSGALQPVVNAVLSGKGQENAQQKSTDFLKQFEGRTGITKLNSTQIFSGMPPVKFSITLLFRAWLDPASEVQRPFNQLMQWALPVQLSKDGSILANIAKYAQGDASGLDALLPSKAPTMIAMQYKGDLFAPLVIESIEHPISSPVDSNGDYVELAVPVTLATLTAIDRSDWANLRGQQQTQKT